MKGIVDVTVYVGVHEWQVQAQRTNFKKRVLDD